MTKEEIIEIMDSISSNSTYKRVSPTHPLELYIGKSEDGFPTLRYNGEFKPVKVIASNLIEIKQIKTSKGYSILFSYRGKDDKKIFYSFCEDMINQSEQYFGDNGYVEIINRFSQWKKMFNASSKLLNESQIMGLIGELLFLKDYCIPAFGEEEAVKGWSGPEPTHKDFSFGETWFETKTMSSGKNSIVISSIEQLDSIHEGKLIVYELEKMSPSFEGVSLNKLVNEVLRGLLITTNADLFIQKLENVGYSKNDNYDNYVYALIGQTSYRVSNDFPRLRASSLPNAIGKVHYELYLSMIEEFKDYE